VFVPEADLQHYRFEPERLPNPEDCESENEEVNDRLEGYNSIVCIFIFLRGSDTRGFLYHCKRRIFDGLLKPSGTRYCDNRLPLFLFLVIAPNISYL